VALQKDFKLKVKWSSYEDISLANPSGGSLFTTFTAIKDENGELLSWYFHNVYKKISYVYYDSTTKTFWLPKKQLYSITKCKKLYKAGVDNYAFFFKGYLLNLIGVPNQDKSMSGFMPPGTLF